MLIRAANTASDSAPAVGSYTEVSGVGSVMVSLSARGRAAMSACSMYADGLRRSDACRSGTDLGTRCATSCMGSLSGS